MVASAVQLVCTWRGGIFGRSRLYQGDRVQVKGRVHDTDHGQLQLQGDTLLREPTAGPLYATGNVRVEMLVQTLSAFIRGRCVMVVIA